jgi:hypothetical protein
VDLPIARGRRHDALTSLAGTMRRRGMSAEAIRAALLKENRLRCDPPLEEGEVLQVASSVAKYAPMESTDRDGGRGSLVELAHVAELFHDQEGTTYATFPVGDHHETQEIRGHQFRVWLARRFYQAQRKPPTGQSMQAALDVLEGEALHEGPSLAVHVRLAEHQRRIYLDLANDRWEVVAIGPDGWQVVTDSPAKFRRPGGLLPLPRPERGGSVMDLFRFVNVRAQWDRELLLAWVTAALRPRGPYPVLVLHGEQGAAKSTSTLVLRSLVDPSQSGLRAAPRDVRDLMIAAWNSHVVAIDNLSSLPMWLSDGLCRLSTGAAFTTRALYTDRAEITLVAQRPVILTGVEEPVTRGDLLDRALVLRLSHIPDNQRRDEESILRDFEQARPRLLGAFLDATALALRRLPELELERLPRMADFARWATAAEPGLRPGPGHIPARVCTEL